MIAIPETIDAIRALYGTVPGASESIAEATADPWLIERVTFETMADALVRGARDMVAAAVNRARHGHEYR